MVEMPRLPLLERIELPADLRALPESDLPQVCRELREFLIHSVSQSTGHFAAGLGALCHESIHLQLEPGSHP